MNKIFIVLRAEIIKQYHNSFMSWFSIFSLFIWPILGFFTIYYTYLPFDLEKSMHDTVIDNKSLLMFLSTGFMSLSCFQSVTQSASNFSWIERQSGTLEIAFLSPASRLAMLYGKSIGAFLQNSCMFICFCFIILLYNGSLDIIGIIFTIFILIISATVWGGMVNAIFLFSRDTGTFVSCFSSQMEFFSGAQIPIESFPSWGKTFSLIFPLTYCLRLIRTATMNNCTNNITLDIIKLFSCLMAMLIITIKLIRKAEDINRERGELLLY